MDICILLSLSRCYKGTYVDWFVFFLKYSFIHFLFLSFLMSLKLSARVIYFCSIYRCLYFYINYQRDIIGWKANKAWLFFFLCHSICNFIALTMKNNIDLGLNTQFDVIMMIFYGTEVVAHVFTQYICIPVVIDNYARNIRSLRVNMHLANVRSILHSHKPIKLTEIS